MRLCWPQMVLLVLVVIIGLSGMLSGCGKKGPLYLPANATTPVAAPASHESSDTRAKNEKPTTPKKPSAAD